MSAASGEAAGTEQQGSGGVQGAAQQVQQAVGQVADQVQQAAAPVVEQAQQTAGQVTDQAREQVTARAESQKDRAVEALTVVAQAVRQTGQALRGQDQPTIAGYADRTAQTVERVAGFLRTHDMGEIMDETQRFARRNPALFLGGSFVLGMLGARFLKSSAPPTRPALPAPYSPYARSYPTASYGQYGAPGTYATPSSYGNPGTYGSQPTYRPGPAVSPTFTTPTSGEGRGATASSTPSFELTPLDRPQEDAAAAGSEGTDTGPYDDIAKARSGLGRSSELP